MHQKEIDLKKAIDKAYRLVKPERPEFERFKKNLLILLGQIDEKETEENVKFHLMHFLRDTFYNPTFHVATKGRTDFVIHTDKTAVSPVGVLFEVKRPANTVDMITKVDLNAKAMHEMILYYLQERIIHKNNSIRHIVITNIYEWFVFDATLFESLFHGDKALVKQYKEWASKQKVSSSTELFYKEIAAPFLLKTTSEIPYIWFNLKDFEQPLRHQTIENEKKLIPLFKGLSPTNLLKLPFTNDSNNLNKRFYSELLHIVGLEEVKASGKKLINRKDILKRDEGSLLENTMSILQTEDCLKNVNNIVTYGENTDEQLYSVALELCITWINRILFLKLLEAQLVKYQNKSADYKFLNYETLPHYDELYKLFFQVLARTENDLSEKIKSKFNHIPYLNSSLFEFSELEERTIKINMLDNTAVLRIADNSILYKRKKDFTASELNTLQYIFIFLESYDFASVGDEEIQDENKTLINASVLGLIFEKINGYKDGSIFTPGFITMFMARQSIRTLVVQKFKEKYKWKLECFEDLNNYVNHDRSISKLKEYNRLINSITICDPAVGSGHYLVSALNELIAVKHDLGILINENGICLSNVEITLDKDELILTDLHGDIFAYNLESRDDNINFIQPWKQIIQKTLFHEKQNIIENCLFGVDINPKSVQICRLRLWIELLKNSYYLSGKDSNGRVSNELQTLPNIDINIKCGNSLVNRFPLDADLKAVFKESKYKIETYKSVVQSYKDSKSKVEKAQLQNFVKELKERFKSIIFEADPLKKEIRKLKDSIVLLKTANIDLFGKKRSDSEIQVDIRRLEMSIDEKGKLLDEKENNKLYNDAFEWRFEFPEILDNDGSFIGFDIIIGNPPYIGEKEMSSFFYDIKKIPEWNSFYRRRTNIYYFFMKRGNEVLKSNGILSYIVPREFLTADWANKLRHYLLKKVRINQMIDFDSNLVFEDTGTTSLIFSSTNAPIPKDQKFAYYLCNYKNQRAIGLDIAKDFDKTEVKYSALDLSGINSWSFNQKKVIGNEFINLGQIFTAVQGILTGVDKVTAKHIANKLIHESFLGRGIFVLSEGIDIKFENSNVFLKIVDKWKALSDVEKEYVKPFLYSINIKKWLPTKSTDHLIYFGGKTEIPKAILDYLTPFREILINRATIVEKIISFEEFETFKLTDIKKNYSSAGAVQKLMKNREWYRPLYERSSYNFELPKIIVNSKNKTDFSISLSPCYASGGGLGGQNFIFPKTNIQFYKNLKSFCSLTDFILFVGAILNSKYMSSYILQGKYNQLSTQKIEEIPLYNLDFELNKNIFREIVQFSKTILSKLDFDSKSDVLIEQGVINKLVEELYDN